MSAATIIGRITAAEKLLSALKGNRSFAAASRAQSAALHNVLAQAQVPLDDQAEVAIALQAIEWHGSDMDMPMAAVFSLGPVEELSTAAVGAKQGRRTLQDYTAFTDYYTEDQWEVLLGDHGPSQKLQVILLHLIVLGLRCPSETSVQRITTLYLLSCENPQQVKAMNATQKLAMVRHVKKQIKAMATPDPLAYLSVLPAPSVMLSQHPVMYAAAFPGPGPCSFKMRHQEFIEVSATVAMRGSKLWTQNPVAESSDFKQAAGCLMQQLQSMQQMQVQQMQLLSGGRCQSPAMQTPLPALMSSPLPALTNALELVPFGMTTPVKAAGEQVPEIQVSAAKNNRPAVDDAVLLISQKIDERTDERKISKRKVSTNVVMTPEVPRAQAPREHSQGTEECEEGLSTGEVSRGTKSKKSGTQGKKAQVEAPKAKMAKVVGATGKSTKVVAAKEKSTKVMAKVVAPKAKSTQVVSTKAKSCLGGDRCKASYGFERTRGAVVGRTGKGGPGSTVRFYITDLGEEEAVARASEWVRSQNLAA